MIKRYYKNYDNAVSDAKRYKCEIVVGGNNRADIYYLVPKATKRNSIVRVICRSQSDAGKEYAVRVIFKDYNGKVQVVDNSTQYRLDSVLDGKVPPEKWFDYLSGYYTLREEISPIIKRRKENARISHMLCDLTGKEGHEVRQHIRRELKNHSREER